jgi:hypothetical protein
MMILHDRDTTFCREFRETLAAGGSYSPSARLHLQLRPPQFGVASGSAACSSTTAAPHEFFGHTGMLNYYHRAA